MNHEELVRGMVAAIHLRSMIKLIRKPDQIVDYVMAQALDLPVREYTGVLELAQHWAGLIVPELEFGPPFSVQPGLFSIRAWIDGEPDQPYPIWMAAEVPSIPVCFAALNRYIERSIHDADLNTTRVPLTDSGRPSRLLKLTPALAALGNGTR